MVDYLTLEIALDAEEPKFRQKLKKKLMKIKTILIQTSTLRKVRMKCPSVILMDKEKLCVTLIEITKDNRELRLSRRLENMIKKAICKSSCNNCLIKV